MQRTFLWLQGYIEAIDGIPTEAQWGKLKKRIANLKSAAAPLSDFPHDPMNGGVRMKDAIPAFASAPAAGLNETEWKAEFKLALEARGCDSDSVQFLLESVVYNPAVSPDDEARISWSVTS